MKSSLLFLMVFLGIQLFAQVPEELGKVHWLRDFAAAKVKAVSDKKPILILFQEIPGCSTCKKFGNEVMSHALISELIEEYFIPLAVYNNLKGEDAKILALYKEPAWNNPVMRIVDSNGKDLLSRHAGQYSPASVISYLNKAVFYGGNIVPNYAKLLEEELNGSSEELTLEMYCFWSGEKNIGGQNGVLYTEPGYSQGHEVVKVIYDRNVTSPDKIIKSARKTSNADAVLTNDQQVLREASKLGMKVKPLENYRIDKDVHYYLKNSLYASIPMTRIQATKVNSAIGNGTLPDIYLSPKQLDLLQKVKTGNLVDKSRYLNGVNHLLALEVTPPKSK